METISESTGRRLNPTTFNHTRLKSIVDSMFDDDGIFRLHIRRVFSMQKTIGKIHRSRSDRATFVRFASVGVTISLIDAGVLCLMLSFGVDRYLGRAISLSTAMAAGYVLNRYFTFHHLETGRTLWHSLLRHYSVHSVGAAINIGVYALVLYIGEYMGGKVAASATLPYLGVWIGGMVGLCFNFFFSKKLVFDN